MAERGLRSLAGCGGGVAARSAGAAGGAGAGARRQEPGEERWPGAAADQGEGRLVPHRAPLVAVRAEGRRVPEIWPGLHVKGRSPPPTPESGFPCG